VAVIVVVVVVVVVVAAVAVAAVAAVGIAERLATTIKLGGSPRAKSNVWRANETTGNFYIRIG
jgi:hypothetical protein